MADQYSGARIVGAYTTKQARSLAPRTGFSVALEAVNGALDDAGMTIDDLDGFAGFVSGGWPNNDAEWGYQLKRNWRWSGRGIAADSLAEAARAISSGYLNAVAFVTAGVRPTTPGALAPWLDHDSQYSAWAGSLPDQPVQFGNVAKRYLHEHGDRALEAWGEMAASTRNFGSINPDAVFYGKGPFTGADVLASRPIADPLTLLMCSVVSDGAGAIIMTSAERAASTGKRGVRVVCGDAVSHYAPYYEPPFLEGHYELTQRYRDTMKAAGVKNDDIDTVQFYDHFASHCLMQYEDFGFCGPGEGADLVLAGEMKLGGRFPTCTDGGNLSFTHPGYPIVFRYIEAVRQLRGEAKDLCPGWASGDHTYDPAICRSVRDADLALVTCAGTPTIQGSFVVLAGD